MPGIDHTALFAGTPSLYLVLDPNLVIVEVNRAYLRATGRTREDLIGRPLFDAFPPNPADAGAEGMKNLDASLRRVLASGQPDTMALQKYDIPVRDRPGAFEERWWSPINSPVLGPDGQVAWIIHRVEDVTAFVRARESCDWSSPGHLTESEAAQAELYARAGDLQRLNERLRRAHARERQVAITLQEAMLRSPDLARHQSDVAVRYLPATGSLNVGGDWYDLIDLPEGRFAVAVGDVVGHGLEAAAAMGMLRSALSASIRALERPAQALEVLSLYAGSVEGALNTTVVKVVVDTRNHLLVYSSAGHPPPVLMHRDGDCELLDQATDPPLGARPEPVPYPQARKAYRPGDTLVLYTDGLIERRGEDIDTGLARLTDALRRYGALGPELLADALLARLGVFSGGADDIALVVVRL